MPIYTIDKAHVDYAIGLDLSAFRNGDNSLTQTELHALDRLDASAGGFGVDYSDPITEETNTMTASQYAQQYLTGYKEAKLALPMYLQTGVPLYATLGGCTTTLTGKETTTIKCVAASAMTTADYFLINCINAAGATVANYVWFQIDTAGADPAPGGTGIEVDIVNTDTASQVAAKLKAVIDVANYYDATVATDTVTVITAYAGAVEDATDYNTDFVITVTIQGASTHTLSLASSQTPIRLGVHFKKDATTTIIEHDFLGFMPDSWNLSCGDDPGRYIARQVLMTKFALSQANAGDLTESTKLTLANYGWADLKHATGAFTIKYNSTDLGFIPHGLDVTLKRTKPLWGPRAPEYPISAHISGISASIDIDGYLDDSGADVRGLMNTVPASYTGDLDIVIKFYKSATRNYTLTFDKMYLVPDKDMLNENDWYEKKTLNFKFMGATSSVVPVVLDSLNKTYYEND